MEELRRFEKQEFENILTKTKSGSSYEFQDFLEMVDWIRKPFTCFVEGHEVSITQDNCATMLENSVIKEITESLFHGQKRLNSSGNEEQQAKKKQWHRTQAVHTEKGATGITALHQTEKRDECQNQAMMKKQIDGLKRELKQLETILAALTVCKNKKPNS